MIERYTRPQMAHIWSEENKNRQWLEVELAASEALAETDDVPLEAARLLRQHASFDLKRIQEIPEDKRTSWRFHVVRAGESLDNIASTFHDRPSEIVSANNLVADAPIDPGVELIVPVSSAIAMPHPLHYITRSGDTLVTIADRFNVTVEDLRRWNHLSSSKIAPHRSLDVSRPVHLAPVAHVRAKKSHTAAGAQAATNTAAKSPAATSKVSAKTSSQSTTAKKKAPQAKKVTPAK